MKRRVFSKTTPFHTFKNKKKKRERAERCRFETTLFIFFPRSRSGEEGEREALI
jgi:hypothetical protein